MESRNSAAATQRRGTASGRRIAVNLAILSATLTIVGFAALYVPAAQASIGHAIVEGYGGSHDPNPNVVRKVERISFADLDLARASDIAILEHRVRAAVHKVCNPAEIEVDNADWRRCVAEASTDSRRQIDQAAGVAQANNHRGAAPSEAGSSPGAGQAVANVGTG